jgi:flagellin
MALSVNTNVGALQALASASKTNGSLETSMARLASGKRINSAADDASGMAIASRLTAEIRGTNMAIRNAADGQSMINTAEGAHEEITNLLQRMRELAGQAANDTNSTADRTSIGSEITQLKAEIDRIANTTWAGIKLLDGNTAAETTGFNLQVGSNTSTYDAVNVKIDGVKSGDLGISGSAAVVSTATGFTSGVGLTTATASDVTTITLSAVTGAAASTITMNLLAAGLTAVQVQITLTAGEGAAAGKDARNAIAQRLADAINQSAAGLTATVSTASAGGEITLSKGSLSVASSSEATATVNAVDTALATINAQRGKLGATSNRLDSTISNLTNIQTNLEEGKGRVEDADFAAESTNMARAQILQQAATAMLAQANSSKQGVLQLLQR